MPCVCIKHSTFDIIIKVLINKVSITKNESCVHLFLNSSSTYLLDAKRFFSLIRF